MNTAQINELLEYLKDGKDFVVNQSSQYAEQLIKIGIYGNIIYSLISLLVIIASIFAFYRIKSDSGSCDDMPFEKRFLLGIILIFSMASFFCSLSGALKAFYVPKVYILESLTKIGCK